MSAADVGTTNQLRVQQADTPEDAIRIATRAAAGLGVPGLFHPGLDEAGMAAIWLTMVITIAKRCGARLTTATAGKFVTAALSSVTAYSLGSKILTWAALAVLIAVPGVALPAAVAMNAALNAAFTYRLGRECVRRFSEPKFSSVDVIDFGRQLVAVPSWAEVADMKRLLFGQQS
jgi:uncharacterized protein (DUF697 family)